MKRPINFSAENEGTAAGAAAALALHALRRARRTVLRAAIGIIGWVMGSAAWAQTDAHVQLELGSHSGAVRRIDVDAERGVVVTGSDDKTARVWALSTGELQRVLRPPVGPGEIGRIYGVALHRQQPWIAVGGTSGPAAPSIRLYHSGSGELLRTVDAGDGDVRRLLWSDDGSALIAAYSGRQHVLRAFDSDGRQVFADAFDAAVYAVAVAPGMLAAAGLDGALRLYADEGVGRSPRYVERWRLRVAANPVSLAFDPGTTRLAVGYYAPGKAPDVVELGSQRLVAGVAPPSLQRGTLMSVAWTLDGRRVISAGDHPFVRRNARLVLFEPGARTHEEIETAAPSTITDLKLLPDGRVAWGAADGSWGVLDTRSRHQQIHRTQLPDLDGAGNLLVSSDGRRLSWTLGAGSNPVSFDLERRLAEPGRSGSLLPPLLRRGLLDAPSDWENHRHPQVNGARIPLAADEVSRAAALFAESTDAALGTSRALYRIGRGGAVVWRQPMHTEVRAVNVTAEGRLVVAAMLDGTLRLHRASDGAELLALLVLDDRRWVMWTPQGYFDAAVGADRAVGWVVNRSDSAGADYYPVARFRERFQQPRFIDLLLETLDPAEAVRRLAGETALERRDGAIALLPPDVGGSAAAVAVPPLEPVAAAMLSVELTIALSPAALPPSLQSALRHVDVTVRPNGTDSEAEVRIPLSVRAGDAGGPLSFEARVDGRAAELSNIDFQRQSGDLWHGTLTVRVAVDAASILIIARNSNGDSEGWVLAVHARPAPAVMATLPSTLPGVSSTATQTSGLPSTPGAPPAVDGAEFPALPSLTPGPRPPAPSPPVPGVQAGPAHASQAGARGGRLFVLTIGVSDYVRPEYRLRLAAKDASDFATAIRTQEGRLYREVIVRPLLDRDATRANVIAGLAWLARAGARGDTFMVFMAGHGVNSTTGAYYFMTADARHEDFAASALSDREIRQALRQLPGRKLMFIDTCHAGNAVGQTLTRNTEVARFVNEMSDNGVVIFAASSGRQLSLEAEEWGNGAFTAALIEGLSGKADTLRAGRITYKGLDFYVSEVVQRLTKGQQTPVSLLPVGLPDFELARL